MNKSQFIAAYMAAFLGSYAAEHYDAACSEGRHARFHDQPIEDARHLATLAWESAQKIGGIDALNNQ